MGAGKRFMLTDRDRDSGCDLLHKSRQSLRILQAVTVGNADLLLRTVQFLLFVFLRKHLDRLSAAPHFGARNNVTGTVAEQDGLDIEHCTDHSRRTADTPCALEKIQVIHCEILTGMRYFRIHDRSCFADIDPLPAQFRSFERQKTVAESASVRELIDT